MSDTSAPRDPGAEDAYTDLAPLLHRGVEELRAEAMARASSREILRRAKEESVVGPGVPRRHVSDVAAAIVRAEYVARLTPEELSTFRRAASHRSNEIAVLARIGAAAQAAPPTDADALFLPEERAGFKYDAATEQAAANMTYASAKDAIRLVVKFAQDSDYDSLLLWAAQTRAVMLLDTVWYLAFAGPKSAGKTTTARVARFLGWHVVEAGSLTPASLPAAMRIANGLLLDEVDVLLRRQEGDVVAGILRQGTDRNSPYLRMEETTKDGRKAWRLVPIPVFGPKLLTFKRTVDDALASRSDLIHMPRARDPKIRRAAARYRKLLLPVKCWLDSEWRRVDDTWTRSGVEDYLTSEGFEAASNRLTVALDRTGQIGDLMLLVGHLYGWPTDEVVQGRLTGIEEAGENDLLEEVRSAVLSMLPEQLTVPHKLKKAEIKARIDQGRRSTNRKEIWSNTLSEVLQDLGLEEGRFSDTDRARSVSVDPEDLARLLQPIPTPKHAGQGGRQSQLPDRDSSSPPSQPIISKPIFEVGCGLSIPPSKSPLGAGPESRATSENPSIPPPPTSSGTGGAKDGGPVTEEAENWTAAPKDRARSKEDGP